MNKYEQKQTLRQIWCDAFQGLAPDDDAGRAARVRALCPCQYEWKVPLWKIVFAACQDESPLVRAEALHVIEDAQSQGFDIDRGMKIFYAALNDPAPEVRRFVADVIHMRGKLRRARQTAARRGPSRSRTKHEWSRAARGCLAEERGQPP